jgi:hypothetical protein
MCVQAWDDLKEMLADGVVTQAEINGLINAASKGVRILFLIHIILLCYIFI